MFEKLNYLNDEERIEFEKYLRIRSKFLFKQIYDYLLLENAEKVNYSDLGTCIRYDKNLRDKLYIYLATFEEYLRAQMYEKYEIKKDFKFGRKRKEEKEEYIKRIAEHIFERADRVDIDEDNSVLYTKFKLDLGETILLIKELHMFDDQKYQELVNIRILRNMVMHHNLLILGKGKSYRNKQVIQAGIVSLSNNLPDGYKQNFIKDINDLRCDFKKYKIEIEA